MKSGSVSLGGIRYRLDVHEGMATFVEKDRMSCARITVQKCNAHGLLYVQVASATGFVPVCHVLKAAAVFESLFGPNHYTSLRAMHRNGLSSALTNLFSTPLFPPWRSMFWRHVIPYRLSCIRFIVTHGYRLIVGDKLPCVEWDGTQ